MYYHCIDFTICYVLCRDWSIKLLYDFETTALLNLTQHIVTDQNYFSAADISKDELNTLLRAPIFTREYMKYKEEVDMLTDQVEFTYLDPAQRRKVNCKIKKVGGEREVSKGVLNLTDANKAVKKLLDGVDVNNITVIHTRYEIDIFLLDKEFVVAALQKLCSCRY